VKVLFEQPDAVRQEQALERMRREMRILFEIRHSNVIPILNYGQLEDGRLWYVMPLAGGTLKDRMPSLPRDAATQLAVMEDIAAGVDALHERGVVHRDLTPANVLYLDGRWVVADFGLTVDLARESEALTQTGWGLGTVHYAPPERMTAKDATTAWDVFSFGQLVLDMISGVLAPERAGQPWPEHAFAPAIRRATAHSPSERFDSCSALVEECRRLQQLEVNEGWESPAERYGRIADELRQPADAVRAFDEMAAVLDREPELVGNFTSSLGALVESQVEELAGARPDAFRRVFDLVVTTLPTNFSSFDALDPMGGFVRRAAVVGDDHLATEGLRWLTQVGGDWNRWHVQGLGQALAEDLRVTRVHVIRPALEACDEAYWSNTLPDPEVLPPDARPRRAGETEPSADIEPF
jgi:serine/threonine protein kinase